MRKGIRYVLTLVALVAALGIFGGDLNQALAATITVTDGPCRIRSDASTTSEAISSVDNGKKLDVLGEVTASDGYTWYKVKVEGDKTGYIRADLVSTPDGSVSSSDSSSKTETKKEETKTETKKEETKTETKKEETKKAETKSEPEPAAEVVESDAVTGTVSADSVTVRSNASTKSDKKASAGNGQEVTITGEATGSDGKTWYQVSYDDNGKSVEGFIRSDFLTVTATKADEAAEEVVEEEVPEVTEAPQVNNDYEVKYEANSEGIEEWFLYDHINGTKQSINNIHDVMQQSLNPVVDDRGEVKTMKIIIIVMAVIMLLLIAAVAILLFRLRDSYEDFGDIDDDYDEDEEDEEEIEEMDDEEDDYDRRRRAPRQKKVFLGRGRNRDYDEYEDEEEDDEDEEEEEVYTRPVRRTRTPERSERRSASRGDDGAWNSRSLSDIDDDMEFEFLDLDN